MDGILLGAVIAPSVSVITGITSTYLISRRDRRKIIETNRQETERIIKESKISTLAMVYAVSKSIREKKDMAVEDITRGYEIAER